MRERDYTYLIIRAETAENRQLGRHLVFIRHPDNKHSAVDFGVIVAFKDEGNGFANYVTKVDRSIFNQMSGTTQDFGVVESSKERVPWGDYDNVVEERLR